ncbi:hypothetical protein ID858_18895 [Xenorhabdus sp. DI]|uniref:hypothetical protein n=1 Tax=Xenorhabdus doucetiae TaxID=351671 RepID=UPI0019C464A1|nr:MULTISPECIES: hypothetical protein [unclassified Xenorhabdus]MBD2786684.1 hypothetical protein [Xenorhabdus sp. 3]MBD2790534.1 hypothetical protein [Xenorhabdus sp. DI]
MSEKKLSPYIKCDKYGLIGGENGDAFIGFRFPPTTLNNTEELFMGLELEDIKDLTSLLQEHIKKHSN